MELKPQQTPGTYKSLEVIHHLDSGIKVFRNESAGDEVFFHISHEPPIEEISSPDDIQTLKAFQVSPDETENEVRAIAVEKAEQLHENGDWS